MRRGLELVEAGLEMLAGASGLSLDEQQELAVAAEKLAQRLRGVASRALGAVSADLDTAAWWWRDALNVTGEAAGVAVRRADGLRSLPKVTEAVIDGRLSLEQAGALTPLVGRLDPVSLADSQDDLVDAAVGRSVDGIGQWVRHQIALHSEADLVLEQRTAESRRMLRHRTCADGTIRGHFVLPAESGEPFLTVIESLSRPDGATDTRTSGQRRADALIAVCEGAARWADLPDTGGQRAQLLYVMSADWAAGVEGAAPAVGAWTGPQTRSRLEAMCCEARISRVLLDGVGQVVGLESLKDEITAGQRRALAARDRHCVARGCTRPPAFCDAHHLVSRADGGPTTLGNLALLCRRHHVMWHQGRLATRDLRVPWLRRPDDPRAGPLVA